MWDFVALGARVDDGESRLIRRPIILEYIIHKADPPGRGGGASGKRYLPMLYSKDDL